MAKRSSSKRGSGSPKPDPEALDDLTKPLEGLKAEIAEPLEKLRRYQVELNAILGSFEGQRSPADKVSRHIRRHLPLYALVTIWGLMILLVPTVNSGGDATQVGAISGLPGAPGTTGPGVTPRADTPGGTTVAAGGAARSGATAEDGGTAAEEVVDGGDVEQVVSGTTRGGFECEPGIRQLPWSEYAAPCLPVQQGNAGASYRGVDEETIKVVIRQTSDAGGPNARAVDEVNRQAGRATALEAFEILGEFVEYFNEVYELYGRRVELVTWASQASNGTEEAQSRGREAACADAKAIAENEQAFAVLNWSGTFIASEPLSDCAAQEQLFVPMGASYFPQIYFNRWHPYVFHTLMECERIATDVAEYIGKRLAHRNAKWAGDPTYQLQERVFGVYVPDNEGYQHCVNIYDSLAKEGGFETRSRFNYTLDVSRFPDQAAVGVLQFKADGVTSLVLACDTISTIFLTQAAENNDWHPEWILIGVAAQDTEGQARLWEQNQVDGHLFGMSQLGSDARIFGEDGEAYRTWKTMHPDQDPPRGFGTIYYSALHIFNLFQVGGPNLTPQSIYEGTLTLGVGGGAHGAVGTWEFVGDHTAIKDSREIYWVGDEIAYDGNAGAYIETYGGQRFRSGEWPAEEPPIYPGG